LLADYGLTNNEFGLAFEDFGKFEVELLLVSVGLLCEYAGVDDFLEGGALSGESIASGKQSRYVHGAAHLFRGKEVG
jgi:hypothetical protein